MVKQRLGLVIRLPDTGIVTIECCPIFEIPLDHKLIKRPGILKQVVNVRLFILPELGRGVLADGVDETVGMDHVSSPFHIRVTIIACFAGADEWLRWEG